MNIQEPYSYNPQNQCYALPESEFERIVQAANALRELSLLLGEMQFSKSIVNAERLAAIIQYPADTLEQISNRFTGGTL